MATVFSHPVVAISCFAWFSNSSKSRVILITGALLTLLPDIDVIGFFHGIPYEHVLGHRGITHSIPFALAFSGLVAWLLADRAKMEFKQVWFYLFLCLASHGLIDALTNGGLGIAFLAPFINDRYFFPFRPIEVSPLGVRSFFSDRGAVVIISELIWVWLPCLGLWFVGCSQKKSDLS